MVNVDVGTLTMLGWVIPLVVGAVTKKWAHPGVKAVANLGLSAIVGGIAVATQAGGHIVVSTWLLAIAATFAQSIISYYGLWKPTGAAPAVQSATAGFGIGPAWRDNTVGQTSDSGPWTSPLAGTVNVSNSSPATVAPFPREVGSPPEDLTPQNPMEAARPLHEELAEAARARRSVAAKKAAATRRANREAKADKPVKKAGS